MGALIGCSSLRVMGPYTPERPYAHDKSMENASTLSPRLIWPVSSIHISRGFSSFHDGLDLTGHLNSPIYAAHSGVVVFAGTGFKGYGRMILLEYNAHWATLYAHLNKLYVKTGERVERGEVIGAMGQTGRATGVHLHFEVLKDKLPVDPLKVLPSPTPQRASSY